MYAYSPIGVHKVLGLYTFFLYSVNTHEYCTPGYWSMMRSTSSYCTLAHVKSCKTLCLVKLRRNSQ
jgi:hypothetical protein